SLGCVLYECLTGRPPFWGEHVMAVLAKVLLDEPTPVGELLPSVPPALEALLGAMMAKAPEARPRDGGGALALLEGLAGLAGGAAARAARAALTEHEQRLVTVVALRAAGSAPVALAPTLDAPPAAGGDGGRGDGGDPFGVRMQALADGTEVAVVVGQ